MARLEIWRERLSYEEGEGKKKHEPAPEDEGAALAMAPGKRTLSQSLPIRSAGAFPPVQQKPAPPASAASRSRMALTEQWIDSAMRPDLHQPPGQDEPAPVAAPVQMHGGSAQSAAEVQQIAVQGLADTSSSLPYLGQIQRSFGHHPVSDVEAHIGGTATRAAEAMGAEAYATGKHVAFRQSPDLHTAAHEAAHVVQQRAGVQLEGGVGRSGDAYERHADLVADRVVQGESAADLLDRFAPAGGGEGVQQRAAGAAVQRRDPPAPGTDGGEGAADRDIEHGLMTEAGLVTDWASAVNAVASRWTGHHGIGYWQDKAVEDWYKRAEAKDPPPAWVGILKAVISIGVDAVPAASAASSPPSCSTA